MIDEIAAEWGGAEHAMDVLATGVNRCEGAPLAADHAGVFETTLLHSLHPDLVHIDLLPPAAERPGVDPDGNPMGDHRHDPLHPLWGIFGPDPRGFDPSTSAGLGETLVAWLADSVSARLAAS